MNTLTEKSFQSEVQTARRALRAFAQVGLEFALTFCFIISALILLATVERLGAGIGLLKVEGRVVMNFWEFEADRLERTKSTLDRVLPRLSAYQIREVGEHPEPHFNQTIVVDVTYRNLTAPYDWSRLSWDLSEDLDGHRGASSSELIRLEGPGPLLAVVTLHLLLIPWMIIRFWFLPPDVAPAKPFISPIKKPMTVFVGCAGAGLLVGTIIPTFFIAMESFGILEFSDKMPSLASLGITSELIWMGAFLLGLGGAVEEAFFRGILLRRFVQNGLPILGVVVCAFWFTVLHAPFFSLDSGNIAYMLVIAAAGLGLGFLTLRTRTWVPAAIAHASYNFTVTLVAGWSLL